VSVPRRRFAARFGRPSLACSLGMVLATSVVLLLPAFAVALVSGDGDGACLCQSPQPPGDPLTVVALLDASHGWVLGAGSVLVAPSCGSQEVTGRALIPQSCAWTVASVGRPPPPSD
jgi:hypothetical protein